MLKTILAYYVVAIIILLSGYSLPPAQTESLTYFPILLSLLLLIPIYVWQANYRRKTELAGDIQAKDKGNVIFWILALFALALSVRIPSVLLFAEPFEKTPLVFLLILTMLIIERTDLTAFGFKTEKLGKSLLLGGAFYLIFGGLALGVSYAMIYGFVGQFPVKSFDVVSSSLTMPFMTFCVGISEEGLFRGYMQTHLRRFSTSGQAIVAQAILFGCWHFVWNLSPFNPFSMAEYIGTTFLFGLLFGYFYSKTKSLVPLIFAHGLWDAVVPWIITNKPVMDYFSTLPASSQILTNYLPYAISAIAAFFFVRCLAKEDRTQDSLRFPSKS